MNNDDEIVKALRTNDLWPQVVIDGKEVDVNCAAADRIESLQAQLLDARNELCQKCGRYHEAHKGSCDGCRWRKGE